MSKRSVNNVLNYESDGLNSPEAKRLKQHRMQLSPSPLASQLPREVIDAATKYLLKGIDKSPSRFESYIRTHRTDLMDLLHNGKQIPSIIVIEAHHAVLTQVPQRDNLRIANTLLALHDWRIAPSVLAVCLSKYPNSPDPIKMKRVLYFHRLLDALPDRIIDLLNEDVAAYVPFPFMKREYMSELQADLDVYTNVRAASIATTFLEDSMRDWPVDLSRELYMFCDVKHTATKKKYNSTTNIPMNECHLSVSYRESCQC